MLRYCFTILVFPLALLRLRRPDFSSPELLLGGLWASFQFVVAAILFMLIRKWWLKSGVKSASRLELLLVVGRTAVDLIVFVGLLQLAVHWWRIS